MRARNDSTGKDATIGTKPPRRRRAIQRSALITVLSVAVLGSAAASAQALTFSKLAGEMTVERWYPIADTLQNGKVLIAGGGAEAATLKNAELFDPASGQFEALSAQPTTDREQAGSILLPDGKALVVGGFGHKEGKATYLDTAETFDPATSTFTALAASMTHPRVGPVVALLPSGKVLIGGGADGAGWVTSAELFDPASGKFEALAAKLVVAEFSGATATLPNGNVLIAGGYNGTEESLDKAELFDPIAGTFSALGAGHLPVEARNEAPAVRLADGNVLVVGGENEHAAKETLSSVERFTWESSTFEAAGELLQPRDGAAAALLPDGRVLVAGGYDGELKSSKYFKTAEVSAVTPATLATGTATAISSAGATLAGSATSEAAVSAYFQYGTTPSYGSQTTKQSVAASTRAVPFGAGVASLAPGTTYHYRAVGENAGGVVYGADQTFRTATVAPTLTSVSQSHARWREGSKLAKLSRRAPVGTTFTFSLDQAASVTLTFSQPAIGRRVKGKCVARTHGNRRKPKCRRAVTKGTLTFSAHAGVNHVSFAGRISASRRLRPGSYTVAIGATNAAKQRSTAKLLSFKIVS